MYTAAIRAKPKNSPLLRSVKTGSKYARISGLPDLQRTGCTIASKAHPQRSPSNPWAAKSTSSNISSKFAAGCKIKSSLTPTPPLNTLDISLREKGFTISSRSNSSQTKPRYRFIACRAILFRKSAECLPLSHFYQEKPQKSPSASQVTPQNSRRAISKLPSLQRSRV